MGIYREADAAVTALTGAGAKVVRGFGDFYDVIAENTVPTGAVMELGVGTTHSQLTWAYTFPGTRVIGIDIAAPSLRLCEEHDLTTRQYANAQAGIAVMFSPDKPVPMRILKNIDIYYNKNGYDKEVADEVVATYGKLAMILNDALQKAPVHNIFLDAYQNAITDDGILIQEKIGRVGRKGIDPHSMQKAINRGWRIFDCTHLVTFADSAAHADGYVAVWYTDNEKWDDKFNHFKEIKNPLNEIDSRFHFSSNDHD